jgi:hypothetical protein
VIRTTLVAEGSSDQVLTQIIDWVLWEAGVRTELISQWADLRNLRIKPVGFQAIVQKAIDLYPCDLLFIHRDSDRESLAVRKSQIHDGLNGLTLPPKVAVVPVKMQEAWLLCDEEAIRVAAGNPSGRSRLSLPKLNAIERIADPKRKVFELLRTASGRTGRKLQQFNVEFARTQICQHIDDFSKLRALPSFREFESDLKSVVQVNQLDQWP